MRSGLFASLCILVLVLVAIVSPAFAQNSSKPADAEGHQWWQHAVFYEVYPRSYDLDHAVLPVAAGGLRL